MNEEHFSIGCTGDVVKGDCIQFKESVFSGSYRKPKFKGERTIKAEVLSESYGDKKQQHTFTLRVIQSEGYEPIEPEKVIRRKGRNIYRNGTKRRPWENELARNQVLDEKHNRGEIARRERRYRIGELEPEDIDFFVGLGSLAN